MEEARQHPALTRERRIYVFVFISGLLALFVGLGLQLAFGGHFLLIGMITFGLSRLGTEIWRLCRPQLFERRPSRLTSMFAIIAWIIVLWLIIFYVGPMA